MKIRFNLNVLGKDLRFYFATFPSFTSWKTGITNRCKDGTFVLFLDYDGTPLQWIKEEILYLQQKFSIGDCHIFKTKNGYHVVNTEKREFGFMLEIMRATSCDPNYINVPLRYGKKAWTLRISDKKNARKISYIKTIKGDNFGKQSSPHNWLLRELYKVKIRKDLGDGEKHFYKSSYPITE